MSNAWQNPSTIAKEIAFQVSNNLQFAATLTRGYEKEWENKSNGWDIGQFVDVRFPVQYTVGTTASIAAGQDVIQVKKRLTLNQRRNTLVSLTSEEMTYSFSRAEEEIFAPAGLRLANAVDAYMANLCQLGVANTYKSTLGTVNSLGHVYGARRFLANAGAVMNPKDTYVALNTAHVESLMPVVGTVFNSSVTDPILKEASFGRFGGATWWESQNIGNQTFGAKAAATNTLDSAYTFATAPTSGTIAQGTIAITGNAATVNPGETFTIAGVFGVKALSEGLAVSTGQLKQFVVATVATSASAATTNIIFYDGAIGAGGYQNVTGATGGTAASAAAAAVVTFTSGSTALTTVAQSLMYNKNLAGLAVVPLAMPVSCGWGSRQTVEGISVRLTRGWDNLADAETTRADILFGGLILNANLGARML